MTHRCGPKLSSVSSMVSYYNSKGFRNTEVLGLRDKPSFHLKEKTVVISEVNKQTNKPWPQCVPLLPVCFLLTNISCTLDKSVSDKMSFKPGIQLCLYVGNIWRLLGYLSGNWGIFSSYNICRSLVMHGWTQSGNYFIFQDGNENNLTHHFPPVMQLVTQHLSPIF